jgi:Phage integrase family
MIDQVKDEGDEITVTIPDTKTKVSKKYSLDREYADIVRRYMKLRPKQASNKRFFLQYRNGSCTVQVIGKNNIATMPKEIAKFLQLKDAESYTGHSLRRSSATIVADSGAGIDMLKRLGDWKSSGSAEGKSFECNKFLTFHHEQQFSGYVADSIGHKRKMRDIIQKSINLPSTSNETAANPPKKIASTITSSVTICSQRKVSTSVNMDSMFDCTIDDSELIDVVDRASQQQLEQPPENRNDVKDQHQTGYIVGGRTTNDDSDILTQSNNNISSLNGAASRTFKSVNFERLDNCTFNFYVSK